MPGNAHDRRLIWVGRAVAGLILVGMATYFVQVGWEAADKIGSAVSALVGVAALIGPYVLPRTKREGQTMQELVDSGRATATEGGRANSGIEATGTGGPMRVERSGDASAHGQGSVGNTGIMQPPSPEKS